MLIIVSETFEFFSPIDFLRNLSWCSAWEMDKTSFFGTELNSFGTEMTPMSLGATILVPLQEQLSFPFCYMQTSMAGEGRKKNTI